MVRKNWLLAILLACAILGATLLASCETPGSPPDPTGDSDFPLCEGKADDPAGCLSLPGEDAVSSTDTTEDSPPDTEQPAPPPDCSTVLEQYPTGKWLDCGPIAGQCQIEWHYDEKWGCLASCPPAFGDRQLEDFSNPNILQCSPANL